ncbi:hypothetical protein [Parachitinimonas caeni]|uniref:Tail fiber protein n=1 Tax=Parachitinimonas caeni TaxID=3031301 RepID=A0ABT7DWS0_9NEIS|nr:hypothetical protein [Parachitinimonas caeni]MDK2124500.1 hypothetical protein [Parachitinimonas caeni]
MTRVDQIIGGSFHPAVAPLAAVEVIDLNDRNYPAKLTQLHVETVRAFNTGLLASEQARAESLTAKGEAQQAATAAGQSAGSATASEAASLAYKNQAATSASNAAQSETATLNSKTLAATSANNAATSEASAANSKTAAQASATAAAGSEANALASKNAAASSAASAEAAKTLAQQYANAPQNTEVLPGEFSAKHWALQARASAVGALVYRGTWSAAGGSSPASPALGDFYRIGTAGIINGTAYLVGDALIYNGAAWDKLDGAEAVHSFNGRLGAITLQAADISMALGNSPVLQTGSDTIRFSWASITSKLRLTINGNDQGGLLLESAFTWANLGNKPTTVAAAGLANAAVTDGANSFSGRQTFGSDYAETVNTLGNVSGNKTIDAAQGGYVTATVIGATTFGLANPAPVGRVTSLTLELTNGGSAVITWPATIKWPGGAAPILTAAGVDVLVFTTRDGGVSWRAGLAWKDSR